MKDHFVHQHIRRNNRYGFETLLIGDTLHDAVIARAAGIHCLLLATGHQSIAKIKKLGIPDAKDISGVLSMLMN